MSETTGDQRLRSIDDPTHPGISRGMTRFVMVALPTTFMIIFFLIPNVLLLMTSFAPQDQPFRWSTATTESYELLASSTVYRNATWRSFYIGGLVGFLTCVLAYPVAYFIVRSNSRWKGLLIGLCLSPLLASIVVKGYAWQVMMGNDGMLVSLLGLVLGPSAPTTLYPSIGAIVMGLTHAFLPYGILAIMSSIQSLNPNLERAAMSLGGNRIRTFLRVTLPLTWPGVLGAFTLSFAITLSAYAIPRMLGSPAQETLATAIYGIMTQLLDWSLGAALGVILIVSAVSLSYLGVLLGSKRKIST